MTKFKKIRFRNILSVGHTWVEIDLDVNQCTMIIGNNGAGKSTILEALYFGCFGKSYRGINLDKIVNRRNKKDMEVQLWFESDGNEVFVHRGQYPDRFDITVNGKGLPQTAKRKYQKTLNSLIGCDYLNASQLAFIGKGTHQPFMKLDAWKRRYFVESVVNLLVFGKMQEIVSAKANKQKTKIQEMKAGITALNEKLKVKRKYVADLEKTISEMVQRAKESCAEKAAAIATEISDLTREYEKLVAFASYDKDAHDSLKNIRSEVSFALSDNQHIISRAEKDIAGLSVSVCSKCGQNIDHVDKDRVIGELEAQIAEAVQKNQELKVQLENIDRDLSEFETNHRLSLENDIEKKSVYSRLGKLRAEKETLELAGHEDNTASLRQEVSVAKDQIKEIASTADLLKIKFDAEVSNEDNLKFITGILSDSGLKASILAQVVPVLNEFVNRYLEKLGMFAVFNLDENFNDSIKVMGFDEAPYASFSEGEKLRIDLAVLLAWRDIAKMTGSFSTNLIFFDEIFDSSLDTDGAEALTDMLNETEGLNVFVITHTPDKIADRVDSVMKVSKVDGYSKIERL